MCQGSTITIQFLCSRSEGSTRYKITWVRFFAGPAQHLFLRHSKFSSQRPRMATIQRARRPQRGSFPMLEKPRRATATASQHAQSPQRVEFEVKICTARARAIKHGQNPQRVDESAPLEDRSWARTLREPAQSKSTRTSFGSSLRKGNNWPGASALIEHPALLLPTV